MITHNTRISSSRRRGIRYPSDTLPDPVGECVVSKMTQADWAKYGPASYRKTEISKRQAIAAVMKHGSLSSAARGCMISQELLVSELLRHGVGIPEEWEVYGEQ